MQSIPQHHNRTPGRRRQSRNAGRPLAHKTYASENDMPSDVPFHPDFMPGAPATPQKSTSASPAPASMPLGSRSNKRNSNKARPKNVSVSPGPPKPGRGTPPLTAGPKSTAAAFAGATFHASPAPSSLPIPSFFAKSMPDSPGRKDSGRASQEPSPPPSESDTDVPTPIQESSASRVQREESPLDIFFLADRAEKERARRASSANILSSTAGPFSPPSTGSPQENRDLTNSGSQQRPRLPFQRNSTLGISATELDGTPGEAMGPAFSTPYQDRIRAARSIEKPTEHAIQNPQRPQAPVDRSDALKRFLFANQKSPSPVVSQNIDGCGQMNASSPQAGRQGTQQAHEMFAGSPPPNQSSSSRGPGVQPNAEPGRSANLTAMENNLRQILKLDSSLNLNSSALANRS